MVLGIIALFIQLQLAQFDFVQNNAQKSLFDSPFGIEELSNGSLVGLPPFDDEYETIGKRAQ